MVEVFRIAILDYTPLEIKYREDAARNILLSAVREAISDDFIVTPDYIRALRETMPANDYDMVLIAGSPLSTIEYSRNLEIALEQVSGIIRHLPTFGICFGLHVMATLAGNESKMIREFEIGPKEVLLYEDIANVGKTGDCLLFPVNHCYKITNGNGALKVLAVSNGGIQIADATAHFGGNPVMGVQFHPEFAITDDGWKIFRRIYSKTLDAVLNGKCDGVDLNPMLKALDKEVLRRFRQLVYDPKSLIGKEPSREIRDLLMSLFHNIDFRSRLLGKKESERNYYKMQRNCRAILRHFVKRAIEAKNARKMRDQQPEARHDGPHDTQLEISDLIGKAGRDSEYRAEVRKMRKPVLPRTSGEKRPYKKPGKQMTIPL